MPIRSALLTILHSLMFKVRDVFRPRLDVLKEVKKIAARKGIENLETILVLISWVVSGIPLHSIPETTNNSILSGLDADLGSNNSV